MQLKHWQALLQQRHTTAQHGNVYIQQPQNLCQFKCQFEQQGLRVLFPPCLCTC